MNFLRVLFALFVAASCCSAQEAGWSPGRVVVEGPLERAVFDVAGRGTTVLVCDLAAGESRELTLPFVVSGPRELFEPAAVPEHAVPPGADRARFVRWSEATNTWSAVPAGLRARSRPQPAAAPMRAPWTSLAVLAAAFALLFATRARPLIGAAVSVAFAAVLFLATVDRSPVSVRVRVIEGDAASGEWVTVDAGRGELELAGAAPLAVHTAPRARSLVWFVDLTPAGTQAQRLVAPGALAFAMHRFDPGARRLSADLNEWGALEATWVRRGAGAFEARGTWRRGEALPPQREGRGEGPPGWLVSGLPQGVSCLVGRLAPGTHGTPGASDASGGDPSVTWIRITSF